MGKYLNWVHGSDVNIEWPHKVRDGGSNSTSGHPRRTGKGTIVRQDDGSNWFHFAIPTPTVIDAGIAEAVPSVIEDVFLHATVNESAQVDRVHVWDGDTRIWKNDDIEFELEHEEVFEEWNITDETVSEGVVISVEVDFGTGGGIGEVTLHSAGAQFDDGSLKKEALETITPF